MKDPSSALNVKLPDGINQRRNIFLVKKTPAYATM